MLTVLLAIVTGAAAGGIGALLGIGGGFLLVPLLDSVAGLTLRESAGASLVAILATSSSVAGSDTHRRLFNARLAVLLLVFSVTGASLGAAMLGWFSEPTYRRVFGVTAAVVAVIMFLRRDIRNVLETATVDVGTLGGRFRDEDTQRDVAYRVRRVPVAIAAASAAGVLSTWLGVGGGILIVPALNTWCGVPIRAAAATSAFMIGITALPGVAAHWQRGDLGTFQIPAAAALGVVAGSRAGLWVSGRVRVRFLKALMATLLGLVALRYLLT